MIYFDWLIIVFHHFYNHNVLYSKYWWLLKCLSDEGVKGLIAINASKYFRSIREEENIRKFAKSLFIFLTTPDEVEKYVQSKSCYDFIHHYNYEILNLFDPELQLINTEPMIKNKLK